MSLCASTFAWTSLATVRFDRRFVSFLRRCLRRSLRCSSRTTSTPRSTRDTCLPSDPRVSTLRQPLPKGAEQALLTRHHRISENLGCGRSARGLRTHQWASCLLSREKLSSTPTIHPITPSPTADRRRPVQRPNRRTQWPFAFIDEHWGLQFVFGGIVKFRLGREFYGRVGTTQGGGWESWNEQNREDFQEDGAADGRADVFIKGFLRQRAETTCESPPLFELRRQPVVRFGGRGSARYGFT